jgi:hypothetical protein
MNSNDKLKASVYLIKHAFNLDRAIFDARNSQPAAPFNGANFIGAHAGGRLTQAGPAIASRAVPLPIMATLLGGNSQTAPSIPQIATQQKPTAKDPSQFFRSYMGSKFDPKSRVDRNKLKFLQSLQSEGMNLEDVKGNQAEIYKRMKGMRF